MKMLFRYPEMEHLIEKDLWPQLNSDALSFIEESAIHSSVHLFCNAKFSLIQYCLTNGKSTSYVFRVWTIPSGPDLRSKFYLFMKKIFLIKKYLEHECLVIKVNILTLYLTMSKEAICIHRYFIINMFNYESSYGNLQSNRN